MLVRFDTSKHGTSSIKHVEVCARLVPYQHRGPIAHVRGTVGEHCDMEGKAAGVGVTMLAPRHAMYLGPL